MKRKNNFSGALSAVLALSLAFSLSSCGKDGGDDRNNENPNKPRVIENYFLSEKLELAENMKEELRGNIKTYGGALYACGMKNEESDETVYRIMDMETGEVTGAVLDKEAKNISSEPS